MHTSQKVNPATLHMHVGGLNDSHMHGCPVVLVDPHTLSPESSWFCVRGAGQLLKVLINCVCIHAFIIVSVHTMSCFPPLQYGMDGTHCCIAVLHRLLILIQEIN